LVAGLAAILVTAVAGNAVQQPIAPLEASAVDPSVPAGAQAAPLAAPVMINQGHDLLETDPDNTYQDLALPAGFFGPGCDPFNGRVQFMGVPRDSSGGANGLLPT
jgi:hypothetical protein